jgi:hypothetical protein
MLTVSELISTQSASRKRMRTPRKLVWRTWFAEENDPFDADIHEASVVTLFLLSSVNLRLRPKLLNDLKPGTRIVSNTFDMGDWKPAKEFSVGDPVEGSRSAASCSCGLFQNVTETSGHAATIGCEEESSAIVY